MLHKIMVKKLNYAKLEILGVVLNGMETGAITLTYGPMN